MDDLDRAKILEMRQRADALAAQQRRAQITDEPLMVNGQRLCLDCEEVIPAERLAVQPESVRCVACKSNHERGRG